MADAFVMLHNQSRDAWTLTQSAVDRGVFGAPTFFVGNDMFWGQDRLDFVRDALKA